MAPKWGHNGAMTTSAKLNLRLPPAVMQAARAEAEAMGISLNAYIGQAVMNYLPYTRRTRKSWDRPQQVVRARGGGEGGQANARERVGQPDPPRLPSNARVGRNDPCPCGSGRKAKHCHPEFT